MTTCELDSLSDQEIIEYFLESGDQKLLSALYQRYSKSVYYKCIALLKHEENAKDLTHDIFLKAFLKLSTLKDPARFGGWLKSITYNMCINQLNIKGKIRKESIDEEDNYIQLTADETEKEAKLELEISLDQLEALMQKLSEVDRMILVMRFQDDMSIKEIQEALDIGESAVKMRLKRAKARLAKLFEKLNRK